MRAIANVVEVRVRIGKIFMDHDWNELFQTKLNRKKKST